MLYQTDFLVRYDVEQPVPIGEIIDSLRAVDVLMRETADFLPFLYPGLHVEQIEIRVRSVAQESPLREAFVLALLAVYQKELEREVPLAIEAMTGHHVPDNLHTIVTVLALILVFYGVDILRTALLGPSDGPSKRKLDELIKEIAQSTGNTERAVREKLDERYASKPAWKRITEAGVRFFAPSKNQGNAGLDVNEQHISTAVVADIPPGYLLDHAADADPFKQFSDVQLELHAQDKDHSGQGWAASVPGVTPKRVRLRLMPGIRAADLWGRDSVRGDVTVFYNRSGNDLTPKAINLERLG